jgi:hypothetical protein
MSTPRLTARGARRRPSQAGSSTTRGVVFERYDGAELSTDDRGIAVRGDAREAWFKDPDGNILAVGER